MRLGHNLLAGLASSVWTALLGFAVVPFYLKYLGIEAYGLIGFFVTTQALLQLLDMGMAPTINREVARCSATDNLEEAGKLLHTLAVVYWGMAGAIALLILVLAPWIAGYWLQSKQLTPETISHAVMLMGLVIACRWPIGLYQGALIGAQRLNISSVINATMVTLGGVGAITVLAFVSPTIEAFFSWQAFIGLVYALTMRGAAWRIIGKLKNKHFDVAYLKKILKFSLGVGAISLAGLVLTQLDKVILSKTLGLESFGKYMLATLLASGLSILIVPVFNSIYPRFSTLVAENKYEELLLLYRTVSHLLSSILFPTAMLLVLLSQPLIDLWTHNSGLAIEVAPLAALLLCGFALHGVMHVPYAMVLAHGETKSIFAVYIVLIIVVVPMAIILSMKYGAVGGALSQFLLFLLYLFIGTWIAHKKILKGYAINWLLKDIGPSLLISFFVGLFGYMTIKRLEVALYLEFALAITLWLAATILGIFSSKILRKIFLRKLDSHGFKWSWR